MLHFEMQKWRTDWRIRDAGNLHTAGMADTPERQDAIRELVRLLRTGYKAYLETVKPQPEANPNDVDSERVRDPAA